MAIRDAKSTDLRQLNILDTLSNLTPWSEADYRGSLLNPSHHIYVLELQPGEIQACLVHNTLDNEAEILQFWVKSEAKRGGLGSLLLSHVLNQFAIRSLVQRVFLEVREDNIAAINLYTKLGFKIVGKRKNYYKVDAWRFDALTMLKELI